jgi:cell division inhibitor SulA/protein ImuA
MEFMLSSAGVGELRLLAPALRELSRQQRWIAWINPPFIPYAPALTAAGIEIEKILLIHPRSHDDTLWALERAAKSGSCSCVLAWPDESKLKLKDTQRLQLASKQGRTLTCLFRPHAAQKHSSMAELRLAMKSAAPGEVRLDILKRRGGWPLQDLCMPAADLTASKHATPAVIQEQLELWRATQETIEQTQQQKYELERKPDVSNHKLLERVTGAFIPGTAPAEPAVRLH